MARARNIKPGFFTNGDLLECQPLARLLFAGLWTEADCRGILEDRPKTLKIKLLPGDNCDVEDLLNELADHGFIVRYEVDGVRCIAVQNFEKHQNPHVNEKPNSLPAPEQHHASTVLAPEQHQSDPAESIYITDSPIPHTESINTPRAKRARSVRYTPEFEAFWSLYPRGHGAKEKTFEQWKRLTDEEQAEIMAVMPVWLASARWQDGMVKDATAFLKAGFWSNPPPAEQQRASPGRQHLTPQQRKHQQLMAIANGESI